MVDKFYSVLFNRKSGKIIKSMEGMSSALLKMFALQGNVSATRDYVIFNAHTGEIVFYCEGRGKSNMPIIYESMKNRNIDEICKGLLEVMNEA